MLRGLELLLLMLSVFPAEGAAGMDLRAEAQLLMKSPDVIFSGTFDLPTRPDVIDKMLGSPILLARLWEVYQFSPPYKASLVANGIHVDDPTGIAGNVFLVEQTANRRVYLGIGQLNHKLVPSFAGKMALVLTTTPKGAATSTRIDIFIRTDSRMLGLLVWTLGPLLKPRIEYRVTANATDVGTMLKDLSTEPQKAARLLQKEDAAALLKILQIPPMRR